MRYRAKRVIRGCFRLRSHTLGGVDIVFLGRHGLAYVPKAKLGPEASAYCRC